MTSRFARLACEGWGASASVSEDLQALGLSDAENLRSSESSGSQVSCLLQQIENATACARKLTSGRSEQQLSVRVRPDAWSVAECLDHLALTTRTFLPKISAAIESAPRIRSDRKLRMERTVRILIRALEPPYRIRHKVLGCLVPTNSEFRSVWTEFLESQDQLSEVIRTSIGVAIDQVKVQSPACARLRYNAYGALEVLAAHQRRHLWQIERILAELDSRAS